ncbi:MAG: hypothetical protein NTV33_10740 [Coprothermobacterota bacterium]|nr:hypothetical protein [Coprothermobacterota bacterium]
MKYGSLSTLASIMFVIAIIIGLAGIVLVVIGFGMGFAFGLVALLIAGWSVIVTLAMGELIQLMIDVGTQTSDMARSGSALVQMMERLLARIESKEKLEAKQGLQAESLAEFSPPVVAPSPMAGIYP